MDAIKIEIGDNGFSLCHTDHSKVGEGIIEGVQEYSVAQELSELLEGELSDDDTICQAVDSAALVDADGVPLGLHKDVKTTLQQAMAMHTTFTGIHHTAFATHDIKTTVKYWRDLLGARLIYSYGRSGYRQYFFQICGNNRISFFEWDEVQPAPRHRHGEPVKGPFVFDHISIGVDHLNDLWDLMARLDAAEQPCSDVIDHGCFYSIYTFDPNGIPLEFSCDAPDLDLSSHPVINDQSELSDFLSESDPIPGQWPIPQPIPEDERIIVPGEGKENFPTPIDFIQDRPSS